MVPAGTAKKGASRAVESGDTEGGTQLDAPTGETPGPPISPRQNRQKMGAYTSCSAQRKRAPQKKPGAAPGRWDRRPERGDPRGKVEPPAYAAAHSPRKGGAAGL